MPTTGTSITPDPAPRHASTPSSRVGMVRRARLEFVATDLLRQAHALEIPVPVDDLLRQPPLDLWRVDVLRMTPFPAVDAFEGRMITARMIAQQVSDTAWDQRVTLLGARAFTPAEIEVFAVALLLPTMLLATLNAQQLAPDHVMRLFQVPPAITLRRLAELGYLNPSDRSQVGDQATL